jgi:hypothetical protein
VSPRKQPIAADRSNRCRIYKLLHSSRPVAQPAVPRVFVSSETPSMQPPRCDGHAHSVGLGRPGDASSCSALRCFFALGDRKGTELSFLHIHALDDTQRRGWARERETEGGRAGCPETLGAVRA